MVVVVVIVVVQERRVGRVLRMVGTRMEVAVGPARSRTGDIFY